MGSELTVMSFNIRFKEHDHLTTGDGRAHPWDSRKQIVAGTVACSSPDIAGVQEAQVAQTEYLVDQLSDYGSAVSAFEPDSLDQAFLILWKREKFEKLDQGSIRIEAPWPHNRRAILWVRLRCRATGRELFFFNTHYPPGRSEAEKAELCRVTAGLINEIAGPDAPAILTGDLNIKDGDSQGIDILRNQAGICDPWSDTGASLAYTWKGWGAQQSERQTIDWILYRRPVKALSVGRPDHNEDGEYPSDHLPVLAVLAVAAEGTG